MATLVVRSPLFVNLLARPGDEFSHPAPGEARIDRQYLGADAGDDAQAADAKPKSLV